MPESSDVFGPDAARQELHRIADWWLARSFDTDHGGFVGQADFYGNPVKTANKGIILNSRILWFFSELAAFHDDPRYRDAADRAFNYLVERFDDPAHGGAVWELRADGSLANGKKQVYAQCFCIYAFCAYHRLTSHPQALEQALKYFELVQLHAVDREFGGYFEAFSQDWRAIGDSRLGAADVNAAKSMNTHLHLLEAYTALHRTAPTVTTGDALRYAIDVFCERFADQGTGHLALFYDSSWHRVSATVSFGHDIEASWLLTEAADALGDPALGERVQRLALRLAHSCHDEGTGSDGQVCNAYDPAIDRRDEESVWWVQAEALLGFLNAYRLTRKRKFRVAMDRVWRHIQQHHLDREAGEWHWLSSSQSQGEPRHYKAGFWKAPYHNGRAMMLACRMFDAIAAN
jgi:cellobiose epimerase